MGFVVCHVATSTLFVVLRINGFSLIHTVIYDVYKHAHNQETEIKVLSLSSNLKQLRYGDRSDIFGWFPNGTAKTILEMAWPSFEIIGGFLSNEMIS